MPGVSSISAITGANPGIQFQTSFRAASFALVQSTIPTATFNAGAASIEAWVNGTWVPGNLVVGGIPIFKTAVCHVVSTSPFIITFYVSDVVETPPASWWDFQ